MLYDVGMALGKRIKVARERLDLTQTELGDKIGVSKATVSGWERELYEPEGAKYPELRRALKVSYIWLLEGKGAPTDPDNRVPRFDSLSPADQAAVETFIEMLQRKQQPAA